MGQRENWIFILASLKKELNMLRIFLAISLIVGALGGQARAAEFIDPDHGTVHQIMVPFTDFRGEGPLTLHKCGGSSFMIGVHVKSNRFACEDGVGWFG